MVAAHVNGRIVTPDQETRLIRGLSENGIEVLRLPMQGALLLRFECLKHRMVCWEPLAMHLFSNVVWAHDVGVASTIEQALFALNRRHNIGVPRI
jgi:hypothetical protein